MSVQPIVLAAVVRTLDPHFAGERCDVRVTLDPHPDQPGNVLKPGTEFLVRPEDVEALGLVPGRALMVAIGPLDVLGAAAGPEMPVEDPTIGLRAQLADAQEQSAVQEAVIANLRGNIDEYAARLVAANAEIARLTAPPVPAEAPAPVAEPAAPETPAAEAPAA